MAAGNFERCHVVTAKWEGGWSNHPDDPGGKTMYGVTERLYHAWQRREGRPETPVRNITRAEALKIYKSEFWSGARCETLAPGVDLATYDASVNSGVSRGRKWLLASIGGSNVQTVKNICAKRLGFMRSLAIWTTFGRGWSRRVADIEAKGVAWALTAVANANVVKKSLETQADIAASKSKNQAKGAGVAVGGSAAGGGSVAVSPEHAPLWLLGVIGAVVLFITVALIVRALVNKHRAEAYTKEASKL